MGLWKRQLHGLADGNSCVALTKECCIFENSTGLAKRQVWAATSTLPAEDVAVSRVHAALRSRHRGLLTIVAPGENSNNGGSSGSGGGAAVQRSHASTAARRIAAEKRLHVELLSAVAANPDRKCAPGSGLSGAPPFPVVGHLSWVTPR